MIKVLRHEKKKNSLSRILVLFLVFSCRSHLPGNDQPAQLIQAQRDDLTRILKEKMAFLADTPNFGGSIGVMYQGQVILQEGYGWADVARQIPCTKDTNYRIASLTKQFTAAGLLLLAQEGKLSPQDTLDQWVPEFDRAREVTLHQLATQSSGLPTDFDKDTPRQDFNRPITPVDLVNLYKNTPFKYSPGTVFQYCNYNYNLLGLTLTRASGLPYEDFVKSRLFGPYGLNRSTLGGAPDLAVGYVELPGFMDPEYDTSWTYADGNVVSNVVDLGRWLDALASGKVLNSASMKTLMTPIHGHYAYGWWSEPLKIKGRTVTVLSHTGGVPGYLSMMVLVPELQLSVVFLTNVTDAFDGFEMDLVDTVLERVL